MDPTDILTQLIAQAPLAAGVYIALRREIDSIRRELHEVRRRVMHTCDVVEHRSDPPPP